MKVTFRIRRDTAANWTSANPVLALGEIGHETDTRLKKTGNGLTAWNDLLYDAAQFSGILPVANGGTGRSTIQILKASRLAAGGGGFQTLPAGEFTTILLANVVSGSTIAYDASTGLASIVETGWYTATGTIKLTDNTAVGTGWGIGVNATGIDDSSDFLFVTTADSNQGDPTDRNGATITALYYWTAGQKVRLYGRGNTAITIQSGSLSIARVA